MHREIACAQAPQPALVSHWLLSWLQLVLVLPQELLSPQLELELLQVLVLPHEVVVLHPLLSPQPLALEDAA